MEPIIYFLPKIAEIIKPSESEIHFDKYPSPKLMKYGFNNIDEQLDLLSLTSIPQYRVGLEVDFNSDRIADIASSMDNSMDNSIDKKILSKFPKKINTTFAEFWEILNLFNLITSDKIIYTSNPNIIKEVIDTFHNIMGKNIQHSITDGKKKATLVINKISDIEIDENAAIQLITNDLSKLLQIQDVGANMILQLFGTQTQTTVELIYFLSSLYTDSFIIKPVATSYLTDIKYLVLTGLKDISTISFPKHSKEMFLTTMNINVPDIFSNAIQCINSYLIPKKYKLYLKIKSYLDTKVYEGATYQELLNSQNENLGKWFLLFSNVAPNDQLIESAIKKTTDQCSSFSKLTSLFN